MIQNHSHRASADLGRELVWSSCLSLAPLSAGLEPPINPERFTLGRGFEAQRLTHERGRWKNNRAENSHQPTRRRERKMQRFKSAGSAQKFLSTHAAVYNTFNVQRHLTSAQTHRVLRATAMTTWREAVAAA